MTEWFTSDWHLGHRAIVEHCHRPFESVEEMDEVILESAGAVIKPKDTVFYLGDLAMNYRFVEKYFGRLPGKWHFFRGNHDYGWWNRFVKEYGNKLLGWHDLKSFKFDKQKIVMCHYPLVSWDKSTHGSWHAHGHSHGLLPPTTKKRLDVGVDAWGFKPVSLDQLREEMGKKPDPPADKRVEHGGP